MPNTPSVVHEGVAGLCAGAHADDAHVTLAEEALAHLGAVVRVPEKLMDAVTAVSGLRPRLLRAARRGDDRGGPPARPLARDLDAARRPDDARHGEAAARPERMHPVELREMVTSPGGTTIAAIRELEIAGVRAAFLNAIQAAMVRVARARRGRVVGRRRGTGWASTRASACARSSTPAAR